MYPGMQQSLPETAMVVLRGERTAQVVFILCSRFCIRGCSSRCGKQAWRRLAARVLPVLRCLTYL